MNAVRQELSHVSDDVILKSTQLYKIFGKNEAATVEKLRRGENDLPPDTTAAVIDASFEVHRGEIFVVMGLSGSGKSTLIRMLNGLLEPTSGSVEVLGTDITAISPKQLRQVRKDHISMVFQHFALLPHRSVIDNVAYGLEIQGMPAAARLERASEVTKLVGLAGWEQHLPGELSGGMRQRVGLARALAADTDILLMDEAFSALDPLIRREMQEQLLELQSTLGKTIIFITHDLNEAMFLGDRIAVMRDGRIVQTGTPEDILTDPANDYVAQFVQDVDRSRVLTASSVMEAVSAVSPLSAGLRGALRVMRDRQASTVLVTDRRGMLLGGIRDRDAVSGVRRGDRDLQALLDTDLHTVSPDDLLTDMLEASIESPYPLAVVDPGGRLLGMLPRVTLLAALGNIDTTTGPTPVVDTSTISLDVISQTLDAMPAAEQVTR